MNAKICHASLWRRGGFYARFYSVIEAARARASRSEARTTKATRTKATCPLLKSRTGTSTRPIHAVVQRDETYVRENIQRIPSDAELANLRPAGRRKEENAATAKSLENVSPTETTSKISTELDVKSLNKRLREVVSNKRTIPSGNSSRVSSHVSPSQVFSEIKQLLRLSSQRDSQTYGLLIGNALFHARSNPLYFRTAERYFRDCQVKRQTDCHVLMLRLLQLTLEKRNDDAEKVSHRLKNESDHDDRLHSFVRILKSQSWISPTSILGLYQALSAITTFDSTTYNTLLNFLLSRKHFEECNIVITDMIKFMIVPNLTMFNILIRRFTMFQDSERVWKIYDALFSNGYIPDIKIATSLIAACTATSDFKRAYGMFGSLSRLGIRPNSHCYSAILTAAAKAMDYPSLQTYFDQMLANNIAPTQFHYAAVIQGCVFLDRFQDGWNMYLDMRRRGLNPDAHVGAHVLSLCHRARRQAEREIVEQDLKDANITLADIHRRKSRKGLMHRAGMRHKKATSLEKSTSARQSHSPKKPLDKTPDETTA